MTDTKIDGLYSLTVPAVLDFPDQLFTAKPFKDKNGKVQPNSEKFGANFIFELDNADLVNIKAHMVRVARGLFPTIDLKTLHFPLQKGEVLADKRKAANLKKGNTKGDDGAYQRGKMVMVSRSKFEPSLAGIEGGRMVDYDGPARTAATKKFFRGAEVLVQFNFVPYEGTMGSAGGVTAYLQKVMVTGGGVKMSGGAKPASETFKGYAGVATTEDPTGGETADNWDTPPDDDLPF